MIQQNIGPLTFSFFEKLINQSGILHFVSTRQGGFSNPPYHSLNLAFHVGDEPELVLENRKLLALKLTIPLESFVTAQQVHEANVTIITESMRGNGAADFDSAIPATDAMVTNIPNICLMVLTADCVPIILFDSNKQVIGVVHAGWKGTVKRITQKTVAIMQERFGCSPVDILAGIGPGIGPCCYEVGQEVVQQVRMLVPAQHEKIILDHQRIPQKYLDLWNLNKFQLAQAGIPDDNIELAGICTRCHADIFYSARHQKNNTGRFGTGIMLG